MDNTVGALLLIVVLPLLCVVGFWIAIRVARARSGVHSRLGQVRPYDLFVRIGAPFSWRLFTATYAAILVPAFVLSAVRVIPWWVSFGLIAGAGMFASGISRLGYLMRLESPNR
ncbi:hypothetical protein [Nocardia heshunensis]